MRLNAEGKVDNVEHYQIAQKCATKSYVRYNVTYTCNRIYILYHHRRNRISLSLSLLLILLFI